MSYGPPPYDFSTSAEPARSADIRAAMTAADRRWFLPAEQHQYAHHDRPLPIGHGQTNSQPSTVAVMLHLLQVPWGARVLDVGSGSGWTTAVLAHLVGPTGSVYAVERDPDLTAWGAANLARANVPWAQIHPATPGVLGHPIPGGYDRILVSAAARSLPDELVDQVADPGRMVIPVQHTMMVVTRAGGQVATSECGTFSFVPLIEDD